MSEHQEQAALFSWARASTPRYPELRLLHAIPNGGARSKATAGRLKAEGVKAGMPDICLPVGCGGFLACYIEMKAPAAPGKPKGRESPAQFVMRELLSDAGNLVRVCWGVDEAVDVLQLYLRGGIRRHNDVALKRAAL